MKAKKPKPTRADLQRQTKELTAQLACSYHFASAELHKAGDALKASGVLIELHALGGRQLINPVVIADGLSADTIAALRRDIARSYARAIELKPKE